MGKIHNHWFSYSLILIWMIIWLFAQKFGIQPAMENRGLDLIDSQYYRFGTALFLHMDFVHVLSNALALYWICVYLEPEIPPAKLLVFSLIVGGIANGLFSAIYLESSSFGGSPIFFALMGLTIAFQFRKPEIPKFQLGTWYGNWTLAYAVLSNLPLFGADGSTVVVHGLALAVGCAAGWLCAGLF